MTAVNLKKESNKIRHLNRLRKLKQLPTTWVRNQIWTCKVKQVAALNHPETEAEDHQNISETWRKMWRKCLTSATTRRRQSSCYTTNTFWEATESTLIATGNFSKVYFGFTMKQLMSGLTWWACSSSFTFWRILSIDMSQSVSTIKSWHKNHWISRQALPSKRSMMSLNIWKWTQKKYTARSSTKS